MRSMLLLTCFLLGLVTPADAQTRACAPRERVIERLADRYGETRHTIGLAANNAIMETFANLETGTWTIIVTLPSGITCLVASGQAFSLLDEELPTGDPT